MSIHHPILSAVVAMAENRVIGKNNQLIWHLPADLKHFKAITTGHFILMGRKTYESIGKPLPNRTNLILTRDPSFVAAGCVILPSVEEALTYAKEKGEKEIFVIGGAQLYQQTLSNIQRIYLTIVHHTFEGDVYFPEINQHEWQEISRERHEPDEKNSYAYSFILLERKPN